MKHRSSPFLPIVVSITVSIAAALAGCSSSGATGPVQVADFGSDYVKALCEQQAACGLYSDAAACEQAYDSIGVGGLDPTIVAAINAGTITYNATLAGECIDAVSTLSCDTTSLAGRGNAPAVCNTVVVGSGATGSACTVSAECASASCELTFSGSNTCPTGTCNPPAPTLGQACSNTTTECASGSVCNGTTCVALGVAGSSCSVDAICGDELGCIVVNDVGTCGTFTAEGASCAAAPCAEVGDYCNAQMICTKLGDVGASCAVSEDCTQDLQCSCTGTGCTDLKCGERPSLGAACIIGEGCLDGSLCVGAGSDSQTGTCTKPVADGGACTQDSQCSSGTCTTGVNTCATPPTCDD